LARMRCTLTAAGVSLGHPCARKAEHPSGRVVTGNYFSVLAVRAAVGRTLEEGDDRAGGAAPAAVLSYEY
jgi:putative ABC transport system permease protein